MFLVDGTNGNMSMGSNFIIGSHSLSTSNQINAVGTTGADGDLSINSYQTVSGSATNIAKFSTSAVSYAQNVIIGSSIGTPTTTLATGGKINVTGTNPSASPYDITLQNQFVHNSPEGTFYFAKVNGLNSSLQNYSGMQFVVGKSGVTSSAGAAV